MITSFVIMDFRVINVQLSEVGTKIEPRKYSLSSSSTGPMSDEWSEYYENKIQVEKCCVLFYLCHVMSLVLSEKCEVTFWLR